jgi:hypothetical protein
MNLAEYREMIKDEYWMGDRAAVYKNLADGIVKIKLMEPE